ncbi:hypothetical protein ACRAWD_03315 [Caulobacter segnis]
MTDVLTADFAITSGGAGADTSVTAAAPSVQGSNAISAGATIDVSAALSTSAAISVTGSAGNDTITIANKSLVTGNGGDDTYVVVASTGGNTYSTVLDANKGDVFKTSALITGSKTAITGPRFDRRVPGFPGHRCRRHDRRPQGLLVPVQRRHLHRPEREHGCHLPERHRHRCEADRPRRPEQGDLERQRPHDHAGLIRV